MKTTNITEKAKKLYFWIEFHKNSKKQWFYLYLPEDAGKDAEELSEYLLSNNHIYDLNDIEGDSVGAYNWDIESIQTVDHKFDTFRRDKFGYESTISPQEQEEISKKEVAIKNIKDHTINSENIDFSGKGELIYNDKLFGELKIDLMSLKNFLLNKNEAEIKITNEFGKVVVESSSWKTDATGKPPYARGVSDIQIWWDGVPKDTGLFSKNQGVGDVSIFKHGKDESKNDKIVIVNDEKAITIYTKELFKKSILLKNQNKLLNLPMFLEEGKVKKSKKKI